MSNEETAKPNQPPVTEGKSTIDFGDIRGQVPKMENPPPPPPPKAE